MLDVNWMRLFDIAARQLGLFLWHQARAVGVDDSALRRARDNGQIQWVSHGLYAVAGSAWTWERHVMAAMLRSGEVTIASHSTASRLHGLPDLSSSDRIELLAPRGRGGKVAGANLHTSIWLPSDHVTDVGPIRLTTIERTLADLAPRLEDRRLQRMYLELRRTRRLDPLALAAVLDGTRNRRAVARLRAVLAEDHPDLAHVRSLPEAVGLVAMQQAGVTPLPEVNAPHAGASGRIYLLDYKFDDDRLDVEVDGDAYHSHPTDAAADRLRDEDIRATGWTVERIPARAVLRDPPGFARHVAALLRDLRRSAS